VGAVVTRQLAVLPDHDLADELTLDGLEYAGLDLAGRIGRSVEFDGCRFSGTDLSGVELERGGFVDCEFDTCNLANLHAADAALRRVRVSGSRMTGFQWINGVLRDVALHDCRLDLSTFRFCTLTDVVFSGCILTRAYFTNADLRRTRFVDFSLAGVQLSHANLAGTRFTRCELVDVGGVTSMRGAVVEGHNLIALAHTLAAALGIVIDPDD